MSLWIELEALCERTFESRPHDRDVLAAIFTYARDCLEWPNQDVQTAVALAFYQDVVTNPAAREHLHEWISRDEFRDLANLFAYHLSEAELARFAVDFHEKNARYSKSRVK